jgi:hypothetical protein
LKRPSFQFYPGDWLQDTALRACSLGARGLWADMLCYMHQGTPYGHLTLPAVSEDGGKDILRPILPPVLARMVGGTSEDVEGLLVELEHAGVFRRSAEGVIFSRRMVQDEKLRETRASGGANSLKNPNVPRPKVSRKDTFNGSLGGSFGGVPSSSSSSSKNLSSEQQDETKVSIQKKTLKPASQEACRLAALLKSEILRNKPDFRVTQAQERNWSVSAQRMLDLDKRNSEQIAKLIRWAQRDEFEMANVLSMDKLRARFDHLELKARKTNPGSTPATYVSASERLLQERNAERTAAGGVQ